MILYSNNMIKDETTLQKLTVVIPTYGRNYYLSRALHYYTQFKFGELIIADSSQPDKKQINKDIAPSGYTYSASFCTVTVTVAFSQSCMVKVGVWFPKK